MLPAAIDRRPGRAAERDTARAKVAVICDFLEERWPSMDLVGDMLCEHLALGHRDALIVEKIRPAMRRWLGHLSGRRAWNADRLLNRFWYYPRHLKFQACEYDLFHVVDHSYSHLLRALPAARTIVTCHDLDTFACVLQPERNSRPAWFRYMTEAILNGLRQASHVIAVSSATRDALLKHRLLTSDRISVIPNGVHPCCSPDPDAAADAEAAAIVGGHAGGPYVMHVGSTIARKRIDVLLRVFAAARRQIPGLRLVRVGGGFTRQQAELARELGIDDVVVVTPVLRAPVLAALYRRAALLLQTSEAEGFGLPVIEAMACGCPVLASDLPVLREVADDAAAYCPVAHVAQWAETAVKLLRERATAREAWDLRRSRALARAARFSWKESARATVEIYRKVL